MRKIVIIIVIAVVSVIAFLGLSYKPLTEISPTAIKSMTISSPSFKDNDFIPKKFTCGGENINPELQIQNVPAGAKSLALIMHDPDAPLPGGFTHWLVWNIAPDTAAIKEGSVPAGSVEGKNDAKRTGYFSPCPPAGHGVHHYHFKLYALDSVLNLGASSSKEELEGEIEKHNFGSAELVGLYQR